MSHKKKQSQNRVIAQPSSNNSKKPFNFVPAMSSGNPPFNFGGHYDASLSEYDSERGEDFESSVLDFLDTLKFNFMSLSEEIAELRHDLNKSKRATGEIKTMVSVSTQTDLADQSPTPLGQGLGLGQDQKKSKSTGSQSYADAAKKKEVQKKKPKCIKKKEAIKLVREKQPPAEFVFLHLKLKDNSKLKKMSRSDRTRYMNSLFKTIGIEKNVVSFSLIGLSVVELYVPVVTQEETKSKLKNFHAEVTVNFDRINPPPYLRNPEKFKEALTHRLTLLTLRSRFVNLNRAILEGIPNEIVDEVYRRHAKYKSLSQSKSLTNSKMHEDPDPVEMVMDTDA
jgi:hypothetical protein